MALSPNPTLLLTSLLDSILTEPTEPIHRLALADYYQEQPGLTHQESVLVDILRRDGFFVLFPEPNIVTKIFPIYGVDREQKVKQGVKEWQLLYRTKKVSGEKVLTVAVISVDLENRYHLPYCQGIDYKALPSVAQTRHHKEREIFAKPGSFPLWYCNECYSKLCSREAEQRKKKRIDAETQRRKEAREKFW